ncbi:MAG: divergent PAP2 family protein [Patescibacteria group bacterium]|jgi:hypothetical protein
MTQLLHNGQLLIIPLLVVIITQFVKVAMDAYRRPAKKFKLKYFMHYGGMPSSHAALFISLVVLSWLKFGWTSFEFVLATVLYLTVVRDAVGIRWHLGEHGKILKQLIEEEHKAHDAHIQHPKIITRLGHTPLEALMGTLCGIGLTLLLYWLIN